MKDLRNIANENGLQLIATTSDSSGYPRNENFGLIGFDSYNQAEEIAAKHGLEVVLFWRRNGWRHYCISFADEDVISVYNRKEYGEDSIYSIYNKSSISDFQWWIEDALANGEDEDGSIVAHYREMIEALEKLEPGEVLVYDGCNEGYTIEQERAISWSYESTEYVVGVI